MKHGAQTYQHQQYGGITHVGSMNAQNPFSSVQQATDHFDQFLNNLKTRTADVNPENLRPPKEYDYLDFEENEKKLNQLKSTELDRYKNMLGDFESNGFSQPVAIQPKEVI